MGGSTASAGKTMRTSSRAHQNAPRSHWINCWAYGTGCEPNSSCLKPTGLHMRPGRDLFESRLPAASSSLSADRGFSRELDIDYATGIVAFKPGHIPLAGQSVAAVFEFDTPVRFDTDELEVNFRVPPRRNSEHCPRRGETMEELPTGMAEHLAPRHDAVLVLAVDAARRRDSRFHRS